MKFEITTPNTVVVPVRQKAFRTKTATGCMTCRIRRIKCDEKRPHCTQCTRGKRDCDGYAHVISKRRQTSPNGSQTSSVSSNCSPISPQLLSISPFTSPEENRCFDFFLAHTIHTLSSSFPSPLFAKSILQATHHESAIRHSVVALAALHESFEKREFGYGMGNAWRENAFALNHYVKAIRSLVSPRAAKGDKEAASLAVLNCVLFVSFEVLRGYIGAAISHIDGGIKLLQSSKQMSSNDTTTDDIFSTVALLYTRLDQQATQITFDRPQAFLSPYLQGDSDAGLTFKDLRIPKSFSDIEGARIALENIQNMAWKDMRTAVEESTSSGTHNDVETTRAMIRMRVEVIRSYTILRIKQWSSAFSALTDWLGNSDTLSTPQKQGFHLLGIQRIVTGLAFQLDVSPYQNHEMQYDALMPEFKQMLYHAREFLKPEIGFPEDATKDSKPVFSLEPQIILPLYMIASKCRDGKVRREAIALLNGMDRQEGILNSKLVGAAGERLISLEEEGLEGGDDVGMQDVVMEMRISGVELRLGGGMEGRRARLRFVRFEGVKGKEMRVLEQDIEW